MKRTSFGLALAAVLVTGCGSSGQVPEAMKTPEAQPRPTQAEDVQTGAALAVSPVATPHLVTASATPMPVGTPSSAEELSRVLEAARVAAGELALEAEAAAREPDVTAAASHHQPASARAASVRNAIVGARQSPVIQPGVQPVLEQAQHMANLTLTELSGLNSTPADGNYVLRWQQTASLARQVMLDLDQARGTR
jgi:hypothetical protein